MIIAETFICRMSENWDFDSQCIPLHFSTLFNISQMDPNMKICQSPEGADILQLYTDHMVPILNQCYHLCEKYEYKGKSYTPMPKTTQVEVCFWLGTKDIEISAEYLIYDTKILIGSVGGTMGLFLGFSFLATWNEIIKAAEKYFKKWIV